MLNTITIVTTKKYSLDDTLMLPGRTQIKIMNIETKTYLMKMKMMNTKEYQNNTQISFQRRRSEIVYL